MSICLLSETSIHLSRKEYDIGKVQFKIFRNLSEEISPNGTPIQHIVIIKGDVKNQVDVLTRIHSECITGDLFGSHKCDCGQQLDTAYKLLSENDRGIIIYTQGVEGRGIGLVDKIRAYNLQDTLGLDTIEANIALGHQIDYRDFEYVNTLLEILGVKSIKLVTNNPEKLNSVKCVSSVINTKPVITNDNSLYIKTKREKLNHTF